MGTLNRINYLQFEILVNSYIYYFLCDGLIPDYVYDDMARELKSLKDNGFMNLSKYYKEFKDSEFFEDTSTSGVNLHYLLYPEVVKEGDNRINKRGSI